MVVAVGVVLKSRVVTEMIEESVSKKIQVKNYLHGLLISW